VFVDGNKARELAPTPTILDNLIAAKKIKPVVAVFVPSDQQNYLNEMVDSDKPKYGRMLAEELVPALEAKYRLAADRDQRLLVGNGFGAYNVLYNAIQQGDTFGNAAIFSIWSYDPYTRIIDEVSSEAKGEKARIKIAWCHYDTLDIIRGIFPKEESKKIAEMLQARGYKIDTLEMPGSHGWGTWRIGMGDVLQNFFGI
jgi:enterochelin esterase family protein